MKNHLVVTFDLETGTWRIEVAAKSPLVEVSDHADALRIARGIAAWTHLPIVERAR